MDEQMQELVRVEVDFREVGPDGRVWVGCDGLAADAAVEAYDRTGNRCRASVVRSEGGRTELDLLLDSFRTPGE